MMSKVIETRPASATDQVLTLKGGSGQLYRREPCDGCPWRVDQTANFSAEAFRHSARTAQDLSTHTFACHETGKEKPADCAGFFLNGSFHSLAVRIKIFKGKIDLREVHDGGHELHADYRSMAEENGVPADDPALAGCRGNDYG